MRKPTNRTLYRITLRAARRKVRGSWLTRGDSFTLPANADVRAYRSEPSVWDVAIVPGHVGAGAGASSEPARKVKASPVSPRANAAFTGLANRLTADVETVGRLSDPDLAGYHRQVQANAHELGASLARVFGGPADLWITILDTGADRWARELQSLIERLDPDAQELEDAAAELEDAADELAKAAGLAKAPTQEPDVGSESPEPAQTPDEPPAAPDAPQEGADEPPAEPPGLDQFRALLGDFASGAEGVTMRLVLEAATAAGLDVPPELHRIRRRDELAQALEALIDGRPAPAAGAPSPADLEG